MIAMHLLSTIYASNLFPNCDSNAVRPTQSRGCIFNCLLHTGDETFLFWKKFEYLSKANDVLSVLYIIANILNRKQTNAKQQQQAILILTCSLCRL